MITFNYKGMQLAPLNAATEVGTGGGWFDIIARRNAPTAMASTRKGYARINARFNANGLVFLSTKAIRAHLTAWSKKA